MGIKRSFLSLLFLSVVAIAEESGEKRLTLKQAIEQGLEKNFSIKIAANNREISSNNTLLGVGGFLPKADASASMTYQNTDNSSAVPNQSETFSNSIGANLNWTLFDGFKMFYSNSSYREKLEKAKLAERDVVERMVLNIVDAYHNLWIQNEILTLNRDQLALSDKRWMRTKDKFESGAVGRSVLLQAEVNRNTDASNVYQSEIKVLQARTELHVLLAMGPEFQLSLADITVPGILENQEAWMEEALANNAGLEIAKRENKIAHLEQKMALSAFWPEINATGSMQWSANSVEAGGATVDSDIRTGQVGLSARWPIFTGFKSTTAYKNSKLGHRSAQVREEEVHLRLKMMVDNQWQSMEKAYERVVFEEKALELAEENFKIMNEKWQLGGLGELELREAQINVKRAKTQLLTTQFQAVQSVYQLRHLAGKMELD